MATYTKDDIENGGFYCLYSSTSVNSVIGQKPTVSYAVNAKNVIDWAQEELFKVGESFESMAGLEIIEDEIDEFKYARELTLEETFELAVKKLGDDGRFFEVYPDSFEGRDAFIEAARFYKIEGKAETLTDDYPPES